MGEWSTLLVYCESTGIKLIVLLNGEVFQRESGTRIQQRGEANEVLNAELSSPESMDDDWRKAYGTMERRCYWHSTLFRNNL